MSAPVFLAEAGALDAYRPGSVFHLDGAEGRHAGVVQRRAVGEPVDVVDGQGVRLRTVVDAVDAHGVDLRVVDTVVEPPGVPELVLVQALAKGDRDELAVEAATEVGVDRVVPWQAERSVVVWRGDRAAKSRAKWLATVRSATKQSRRARIPAVDLALDSKHLAAWVEQTASAGGTVLVLHEDAPLAIADVLAGAHGPASLQEAAVVAVVVGPEGGISDGETTALVAAGAVVVRLGPHVLRTSTAGPVALALLATHLGRW